MTPSPKALDYAAGMTPALDVRERLTATRAGQRLNVDPFPSITKVNAAQRRKLETVLGADKARLRKLNPYWSQDSGVASILRSMEYHKSFRAGAFLAGRGDVLTRSMTPAVTKAIAAAAGPLAAQQTVRSRALLTGEHTWATRPFITPRTRDTISEVARTAFAGLAPQIDAKAHAAAAGAGRFDKGAYRGLASGMWGPTARDTFPGFVPQIDTRAIAALLGVAGFKNPAYAGLASQIGKEASAGFRMPRIDAKALAGYTVLSALDKGVLAGIMPRIDTRAASALAGFGGLEKARVAALTGSYCDRAGWGDIASRTLADLYPTIRSSFGQVTADLFPAPLIVAEPGGLADELGVDVADSPLWLPSWSIEALPLDDLRFLNQLAVFTFAVVAMVMVNTGYEYSSKSMYAVGFVEASIAFALLLIERRQKQLRSNSG